MSDSQKHETIGKAVSDLDAARRNNARIRSRIGDMARSLDVVCSALKERSPAFEESADPPDRLHKALDAFPSKENIARILAELDASDAEIRKKEEDCTGLGLDLSML